MADTELEDTGAKLKMSRRMAVERKSIFKRGAEQGAIMGAWLAALYICMAYCLDAPFLGMLAMGLIMGVPVLTYVMLRRSYVADMGLTKFSELWTQGIVIFACGSLIMAVVSIIHARFLDPGFIVGYMNQTIDLLRDSGEDVTAGMLEKMLNAGAIPSAADFAMEFIWLGIFSGSILSMLMALLVMSRKVKLTTNN